MLQKKIDRYYNADTVNTLCNNQNRQIPNEAYLSNTCTQ